MCSDQVPKLIPFRTGYVRWYGQAPEAATPRVSSSMLPNGFAELLAEAHGAEVHNTEEVDAISCPISRHENHV